MKIKAKINKNANLAMATCRVVLTKATIELLKMIAEPGQDVFFDRTLFLYQTKENVSETILINNIAYGTGRGGSDYYIVSMGDDKRFCKSDIMLSLSNLQVIYEEVRKLVRNY